MIVSAQPNDVEQAKRYYLAQYAHVGCGGAPVAYVGTGNKLGCSSCPVQWDGSGTLEDVMGWLLRKKVFRCLIQP